MPRTLMTGRNEPEADPRRRIGARWIFGAVAALLLLSFALAYRWGTASAEGWKTLIGRAADSVAALERARPLPSGSAVVFRSEKVATLTSITQLPREESLGGALWVIDGEWESTPLASTVRADTTLAAVMSADPEGSAPVRIELVDRVSAPSRQPRGLLRLRPFHSGYRIY